MQNIVQKYESVYQNIDIDEIIEQSQLLRSKLEEVKNRRLSDLSEGHYKNNKEFLRANSSVQRSGGIQEVSEEFEEDTTTNKSKRSSYSSQGASHSREIE